MTKNQPISNQEKNQNKQTILQTIKNQKPENTQQLVKSVQERAALSCEEITQLLIQLESEEKLHFTEKEALPPPTSQTYFFSKEAAWYWVIITVAIVTTLTVFAIPDNVYPIVYLRSALGMVFMLLLPGYSSIKMLFPSKVPIKTNNENMDTIERLALSIGMSTALVPMVGLVLNYTPLGIRLTPIIFSLLALIIVFATVAVLREYQEKLRLLKSAPSS
jgi:hypothetical protein